MVLRLWLQVETQTSVALASAYAKIITQGLSPFSARISNMIDAGKHKQGQAGTSINLQKADKEVEIHTDLYRNMAAFLNAYHVSLNGIQKCSGLNPEISMLSFLNEVPAAVKNAILLFCNCGPDSIDTDLRAQETTNHQSQHIDTCALFKDPLLANILSYVSDIGIL